MAIAPIEFAGLPTGLTLTTTLYPLGSDTATAAAGLSLTERTNAKGIYRTTTTAAITGWHRALVLSGSDVIGIYDVLMDDTTADHYAIEHEHGNTHQSGDSYVRIGAAGAGLTALGDTRIANLDASVAQNAAKYANGAVWIGPSANMNTVNYTDGIITNPVSTIAAGKTIADSLKIRRFEVIRTGTAQVGADMTGYRFSGVGWSLTTTGGSRDVGTTAFLGASVVDGTFASTTGTINWEGCEFTTGVTVGVSNMIRCLFQGTLTLSTAGQYDFIDCASVVAGTAAPVFAVPAGTVNISFRRWSGGIRITGITTGTTISIDAVSGGTVTLEGADGNVQVRGLVAGITDSRTGTPTLGQNAAVNITKINTECDTALTDYDPPTRTEATSDANSILAAVDAVDNFVDTEVSAIKAKTDNLPADPADASDVAAAVAAVQVAILAKLPAALTVDGNIKADTLRVGGTLQTAGDLAALTAALTLYASRTVVRGTVGAATVPSTTQFTPSALSPSGSVADQFKGRILVWDNDTATVALRGQATDVTVSSGAALPLFTMTALTTAPASGDTFSIV